eukprot:TRINITY_DN5411_c0_g1_i1.p1 TRINITY_DN5411_c0_g1~~TRINITY_DN5411_c0_g1_i1.p1  ORF type:complete len:312 (+),score=60.70 TRINITY_DN5411_c0_g1_i1:202-1137(+)
MALCFRSLARSSARGSFVFTPTTPFSGKLLHFPSWNLAHRRSGFCNSAASLKSTTNDLLKDLDKTNHQHVRPILEQARRTATTKEVFHSDFLTPPVLEDTISALTKMPHVDFLIQGGYPQAERCRLTVGHRDVMSSAPDAVSAISISGNFSFDPTSDVDFLEAILSTGAKREKVGDILLQGDKGAQTIVASELVDHLVCSIKQVRRVPVSCSAIPLLALEFRSPRTKVLKSVEASLRVDAVASAGFQISRSKLVSLISTGDVHVNGTNVTKNGIPLKTGDIISIRGKGRVQLGEIKTTRKGKFSIELIRYL